MDLTNKLTYIILLGMVGYRWELERAGFFPLYVNELNKDAIETYLLNRDKEYPHLRQYNSRDIKEVISDPNFLKIYLII